MPWSRQPAPENPDPPLGVVLHYRGRAIPCTVLRDPDLDEHGCAAWIAVPDESLVILPVGEDFRLTAPPAGRTHAACRTPGSRRLTRTRGPDPADARRLRLRLAPAWLRAQPRRRPLHAGVLAVTVPVLAGLLLVCPRPGAACNWRPAPGVTRPHLTCATVRTTR